MTPWPHARALLGLALAGLLAACSSSPDAGGPSRVRVVDSHGIPIMNATLLADDEFPSGGQRVYSQEELNARASDAQGYFHVDLDESLWRGDGFYHFRVHRVGYEDEVMVVSKDLFPPLLRIEMKAAAAGQQAAPGR
jgi:hypothetical protein